MANQKHICGVCGQSFKTEEEYVSHGCDTGYTPADSEHQLSEEVGRAKEVPATESKKKGKK